MPKDYKMFQQIVLANTIYIYIYIYIYIHLLSVMSVMSVMFDVVSIRRYVGYVCYVGCSQCRGLCPLYVSGVS